MLRTLTLGFCLAISSLAIADDKPADLYPESLLYSQPIEVVDGLVWSSIGATSPPSYVNAGHNNNLSFIVTDEGVVVINASDNYQLAKALHDEVRKITDQPVRYVILENGQGHAMLGSNYWHEQGAEIIAHRDTAEEIERHGKAILQRMMSGRKDRGDGTELTTPDIIFDDQYELTLGGVTIQALHLGPAHSPGDTQVYLPDHKAMISGDIAFNVRMPPIFEDTDTAAWLDTWETFIAMDMDTLIPGHGGPTDKATVTHFTKDYLTYMREQIGALIDEGGTMTDVYDIDQSRFEDWDTYTELNKVNAQRIFSQMEFE